jgi:thioredoxin reductase (NADPH)
MTIVIYSKNNCVYCTKAKNLVKNLGLDYTEKMMESFESVDKMLEDIGKQVRQMPQIKIDGELIGGYNQLVEYFEKQGKVNFKGEIQK